MKIRYAALAVALTATACSKRDGFRTGAELVVGQWDAKENHVLEVGSSTPVELTFFNGTGDDCAPLPSDAMATIDNATLSMTARGGVATEPYAGRPPQYRDKKGKECRPAVFRLIGPRPTGKTANGDIQISIPGGGSVSCRFDNLYAPRVLTVTPAGPLKEGDKVTVTALPPDDLRSPNRQTGPLTLEACGTKIQGADLKVENPQPNQYVFALPKLCAGRARVSFSGGVETPPVSSSGTKCRVQRYSLEPATIDIAP